MDRQIFWYYFSLGCLGHIGFAVCYVQTQEYSLLNGLWWSILVVMGVLLIFPEYLRSPEKESAKVSLQDQAANHSDLIIKSEKKQEPSFAVEQQGGFTVKEEREENETPVQEEQEKPLKALCIESQTMFTILPVEMEIIEATTEEITKVQFTGEPSASTSPPGLLIVTDDTLGSVNGLMLDSETVVVTLDLKDLEADVRQETAEPNSSVIAEDYKINERKPMVFIGGLSASITPLELVQSCKLQGFNITVVPRIRYGVSFGFCPDLVLSSDEEMNRILSMGRIWIKDRWCDVRPYIAKDSSSEASGEGGSNSNGVISSDFMYTHQFTPSPTMNYEFACSPYTYAMPMPYQVPAMFPGSGLIMFPSPEQEAEMMNFQEVFPQVQPFPQEVLLETM